MNKIIGFCAVALALTVVGCSTKASDLLGKNVNEIPYKKEHITLDTTVANQYRVVGYAEMSTQTSSIGGFGAIAALKQACMIDFLADDKGVIHNYRIRARKPGDCEGLGKKREHKVLRAYFKQDVSELKAKWGEPAETYTLPVEENVKCSESSLFGDCPKYIFNVAEEQVLVYKEGECKVHFVISEKNIVSDYFWEGNCDKLSKK